ncbi:Uncharacterised protein [Candidatus Anstonella stagnisolia]|nr:Uncharacterised protein [Candidatus Anstonella stagnisolia]
MSTLRTMQPIRNLHPTEGGSTVQPPKTEGIMKTISDPRTRAPERDNERYAAFEEKGQPNEEGQPNTKKPETYRCDAPT